MDVEQLKEDVRKGRISVDRLVELVVALQRELQAAKQRIDELEQKLIQPKQKTQQDIVNYRSQLGAEYLFLSDLIDSSDPPVNAGARQRLDDLDAQWRRHQASYQALVDGPLADFNRLFEEQAVPAVILKP